MSRWKPEPKAALSIPCTGALSEPKQDCDKSVAMLFPITLEKMTSELKRIGWFVTARTPPGTNPPEMGVLCGDCADALIPELAKAAREVWKKSDS